MEKKLLINLCFQQKLLLTLLQTAFIQTR